MYDKLLLTTQWRKKRQKIIERDNYKCTVCGSNNNLQVHHTYYYKNQVDPWLYPNKSLLTICEKCHNDYHIYNEIVYKDNPKIKSKKIKMAYKPPRRLTDLEKMTLKYWEVETTSRSGKSIGVNCFYARDKNHVINIMKKKKLPIFNIRDITNKIK